MFQHHSPRMSRRPTLRSSAPHLGTGWTPCHDAGGADPKWHSPLRLRSPATKDSKWEYLVELSTQPTFCTSVRYWDTMKGANTVKSSAWAATWLHILSTRRAHSRTAGRSSAPPAEAECFQTHQPPASCLHSSGFILLLQPQITQIFHLSHSLTSLFCRQNEGERICPNIYLHNKGKNT